MGVTARELAALAARPDLAAAAGAWWHVLNPVCKWDVQCPRVHVAAAAAVGGVVVVLVVVEDGVGVGAGRGHLGGHPKLLTCHSHPILITHHGLSTSINAEQF